MKTALAATFAEAMLAASSVAFAADNNGGKNDNNMDNDKTGSINNHDPIDPPDQKSIEYCQTAPADDANCRNMLSR